jgi:predicted hydrocarbon binding protein
MPTNQPYNTREGAAQSSALEGYFPNKMGRIALLAFEEVVGREVMETVLTMARMPDRLEDYPPNNFAREFSFEELAGMQLALEELYGVRSGRGLVRKIGSACFRIGAEDLRAVLGVADLAFRVLPLRTRLRVGFETLAQISRQYSDHRIRLEEDERHFRWIAEQCGVCWGRRTDAPCCHLSIGLLEELLYWLAGGEKFYIEEISCIATGDPTCTILIGKHPQPPSMPSTEDEA